MFIPYPGSRFFLSRIPKQQKRQGEKTRCLTRYRKQKQKHELVIRDSRYRKTYIPDPDLGVKKEQDPGSATLSSQVSTIFQGRFTEGSRNNVSEEYGLICDLLDPDPVGPPGSASQEFWIRGSVSVPKCHGSETLPLSKYLGWCAEGAQPPTSLPLPLQRTL